MAAAPPPSRPKFLSPTQWGMALPAPGLGGREPGGLPQRSLTLWVVFLTLCNVAGWVLSVFDALTVPGYLAVFLLSAGFFFWLGRRGEPSRPKPKRFVWSRVRRRFCRPFPLAFLGLALLSLIGGALYLPSNYDGLAYRVSRVMHWLDAGHWHWIPTEFERINTRGVGWEWAAAPLILFSQGLKATFLISYLSFLLLPGVIYSTFVRLGVRRRVAWYWMWLLPCAYCLLLQAASIGNEFPGALLAIAAVNYALRAQQSRRPSDLWLSLVCIALMTGTKASNLPLMLPWAVAVLPVWKRFFARPVAAVAVLVVAFMVSVGPITVANLHYSGDFFGMKVENHGAPAVRDPWLRFPVNLVLGVIQNVAPPVFPLAGKWNAWVASEMSPEFAARMARTFPSFAAGFKMAEMSTEEIAGLGFGLTLLLAGSVGIAWRLGRGRPWPRLNWLLLLAPWVALLPIVWKANITSFARVLAPYYPLLIPLLLVGVGWSRLVRSKGWRVAAWMTFPMALVPLVLSPTRPLFPVEKLISKLPPRFADRAKKVYRTYSNRPVAFAPVQKIVPPGTHLGMVTMDDPEAALWFPMGQVRVSHLMYDTTPEQLRQMGVEYVLVKPEMPSRFKGPAQAWMARMKLGPIREVPLELRAGSEVISWFLAEVPPLDQEH